jgi:hypothetical protein
MPVDLAVNDIVEISIEGKINDQQTISTFHYRVGSISGAFPMFGQLAAFLTALRADDKLFNSYQHVTSDQLDRLNMYAQVIYPIRYRYTNDEAPDETGAVDSLAFPPNVQASITRAAERAGRRYVSHLAVPAVPIGAIVDGKVTDAYKLDLLSLANEMVASYVLPSGAELNPVIFHPQFSPIFDQITFAFPQTTSRVQRRRTVGLGI